MGWRSTPFFIPFVLTHPTASSFAKTLVSKKGIGLFYPFAELNSPVEVFAATPPYDGTLARYYRIPGHVTYKLPENLTLEDGALVFTRILFFRSASNSDLGE